MKKIVNLLYNSYVDKGKGDVMAKRKKKKEVQKKFEYSTELYGILLILAGILGICGYGPCGKLICAFFAFLFGSLYLVPLVLIIILGIYVIFNKKYPDFFSSKVLGITLAIVGVLMVLHTEYIKTLPDSTEVLKETFNEVINVFSTVDGASREMAFRNIGGGMLGGLIVSASMGLFAFEGTRIIYWILIVSGALLFTGVSLVEIIRNMINKSKSLVPHHKSGESDDDKNILGRVNDSVKIKITDVNNVEEEEEEVSDKASNNKLVINSIDELKSKPKVMVNDPTQLSIDDVEKEPEVKIIDNVNYTLPSTSLLDIPKKSTNNNQANIESNINKLEEVLREFGITGKVVAVTVGPAFTQYELALKAGTKLSKLTSINKEISLVLAKKDVRIQAPIPGKSTVGIEIANDTTTTVYIRDIMESLPKDKKDSKLLVALGKDIMSNTMYCEINKTPHLLVAGSTGSGKSVCINCILASILMRTKPDEVKLLLVDPKKVELSMYNGVPHLLAPVVTDPKKASVALAKIVSEMERRYDIFEEKGVKNIGTYNEYIEKKNATLPESEKIKKMPYIVVIVDELADLMLVASKEVEDSIMRITQMARAAGIHLIIATQRPSTDVITGVIKANIPSRISFAVSSGIDSRTILDMTGAEKLLGRGDMLFLPSGENTPIRIQGAWITEDEIHRIVDYVVNQQKAQYDEKMLNLNAPVETGGVDANTDLKEEYDDPLYDEIVEFVITTGKASASLLQRRFKLGYNRAARVIDLLEERGIIGPMNGSKPREVLVKLESDEEEEVL